MPNTPKDRRHPALAQQQVNARIRELDQESIDAIEGWETFNAHDKNILTVLPWFGTRAAAVRFVTGTDMEEAKEIIQRYDRHVFRTQFLQAAFVTRTKMRTNIIKEVGTDMLGLGLFWIQFCLTAPSGKGDGQIDWATRRWAVDTAMRMNKVGEESPSVFGGGNVINIGTVGSFAGARSQTKAIPAEAEIVDDTD